MATESTPPATVTVSRAALAAVLDPTPASHGRLGEAVAHLRHELEHQPPAAPAWRCLAGPISWWKSIDNEATRAPAHQAALDGVQAAVRATFARAELDITDPANLYPATVAVAFLRITAQRDAQLGRLEPAEAAAVIDATNAVGVALTRWVAWS